MNTEQKRIRLIEAYPGPNWKSRVLKMSEKQVVALYLKFQKEGKIR